MSYSMITAILLAVIALSSSSDSFSNLEKNVLGRFYQNFAQLYRPAIEKRCPRYLDDNNDVQCYQYRFTEKQFSNIASESMTMLYTNITERAITYHENPNFEEVGTRYLYRPDQSEDLYTEIELVNPEDRLFRSLRQPAQYFYLESYDNLHYLRKKPISPYYDITFICNLLSQNSKQTQFPTLTYIDKSYRWTPRYLVDFSVVDNREQSIMYAYADLYNSGSEKIVVKSAEFISGDIRYEKSIDDLRAAVLDDTSDTNVEDIRGSYAYQVNLQSPVELLPYSTKSIQFIQPEITVTPFRYYKSVFSDRNSTSKLSIAYNLTSHNDFLPSGALLFRDQGRYIGESFLSDITRDETFTMVFGYDANVSYNRRVKIVSGSEDGNKVAYSVTYKFENFKSEDVRLYFIESFVSFENYQISNISNSDNEKNLPDLKIDGEYLRGYITIPAQRREKIVGYTVTFHKIK